MVLDRKVVCIDLYGIEEIYMHYFPKLRDSAFKMANTAKENKLVDLHEAYYKVLDILDNYDTVLLLPSAAKGLLKALC
ncbi:MAG: hypothetical protein MUO72_13420 [Bacteroidales bacterium]|nr:hypothetical protein [Bacteroidales bacterium]